MAIEMLNFIPEVKHVLARASSHFAWTWTRRRRFAYESRMKMRPAIFTAFLVLCTGGCDSSSPDGPVTKKKMFITSSRYTGNLAGLAGGDTKCRPVYTTEVHH